MDRSITFREIVKLIHPDHNPHIVDAGGKMRDAKLFRGQPEELYKLAVRWGLMGGTGVGATRRHQRPQRPQVPPQPPRRPRPRPTQRTTEQRWDTGQTRQAPPRTRWQEFSTEAPRVGGFVFVLTKSRVRVQVVRMTPKRVYFFYEGKRTFALRKNVRVAREVRVN